MANLFRKPDGRLDRQALRIAAAYKLIKRGSIDAQRAADLLRDVGVKGAEATVSHWTDRRSYRHFV